MTVYKNLSLFNFNDSSQSETDSALTSTSSTDNSDLLPTFNLEIESLENLFSFGPISQEYIFELNISLLWPLLIFNLFLAGLLLRNFKQLEASLDANHFLLKVAHRMEEADHAPVKTKNLLEKHSE